MEQGHQSRHLFVQVAEPLAELSVHAEAHLSLKEDEASAEDRAARREAVNDDLRCFITFAGPEDGTLGIGLYAHTPSSQQWRAGLPPDFELACDYLDAEAFNMGVRQSITRAVRAWNRHGEPEPPSMVSSTRGRINAWLPLYINSQHWAEARRYVPAAIAQLAAARGAKAFQAKSPNGFRPSDALNVCCTLLTRAVVGFTKGTAEAAGAEQRAVNHAKVSERAVQMYADVHRLLLQLAKEHPEIGQLASQRLRAFVDNPAARTQRSTPSLGNLVHSLLVAEDFTWEQLAPTLLPEAMRRHACRERARGQAFDPWPQASHHGDAWPLVAAWDTFAPQFGLVTGFCVAFLQRVGRPQGLSLDEIAASYDQRWGRLPADYTSSLVLACAGLVRRPSWAHLLAVLSPESDGSPEVERAAELILWAEQHGRKFNAGTIPAAVWPSLSGKEYPLLRHWQAQWQEAERAADLEAQWQEAALHHQGTGHIHEGHWYWAWNRIA